MQQTSNKVNPISTKELKELALDFIQNSFELKNEYTILSKAEKDKVQKYETQYNWTRTSTEIFDFINSVSILSRDAGNTFLCCILDGYTKFTTLKEQNFKNQNTPKEEQEKFVSEKNAIIKELNAIFQKNVTEIIKNNSLKDGKNYLMESLNYFNEIGLKKNTPDGVKIKYPEGNRFLDYLTLSTYNKHINENPALGISPELPVYRINSLNIRDENTSLKRKEPNFIENGGQDQTAQKKRSSIAVSKIDKNKDNGQAFGKSSKGDDDVMYIGNFK